jgi:Zn-dependent protease
VFTRSEVCAFVALVFSLIVHEVAHGVVALWHGDDTAKRAGRITLNPAVHVDPLGSLVLPAMAALAGFPAFGWAKPVPVNPNRMRHPRGGMLRTSLAGPGINIVLMVVFGLAARFAFDADDAISYLDPRASLGSLLLFWLATVNLLLATFNLLPIPPLDGAALIERLVPARRLGWYRRIAPYGMLVIFGIVLFSNVFSEIVEPLFERLDEFIVG